MSKFNKRKYVPTYEQFSLNEESFMSRVGQGIKTAGQKLTDLVKKGIESIQNIFSHPQMQVTDLPGGGTKAVYVGAGSVNKEGQTPSFAIIDYTGVKPEVSEARQGALGERIPLESQDEEVIDVDNEEFLHEIMKTYMFKTNPLYVLGAPGIGKTQIIENYAQKEGLMAVVFNTSTMDPTDFMGLPAVEQMKDGEGRSMPSTTFALPKIWPRSNRIDGAPLQGDETPDMLRGGILFFDELSTAPVPVLNACLQLLGSRALGQYKLPSKWVLIAAGNRHGENNIEDMNAAMSNRFKVVNFVPDFDAWTKWGRTDYEGKEDDPNVGVIQKNVREEIIQFLLTKPEYFHYLTDESSRDANTPWPSPRSWTHASQDMYRQEFMKKKSGKEPELTAREAEKIVSMHVGASVGREFGAFWTMLETFDPKDIDMIFTDGKNAPLPKDMKGRVENKLKQAGGEAQNEYNIDIAYSFGILVAFRHANDTMTHDQFENFVEYLIRLNNEQLATIMMGTAVRNNPSLRNKEIKKVVEMFKKYAQKYSGSDARAALQGNLKIDTSDKVSDPMAK